MWALVFFLKGKDDEEFGFRLNHLHLCVHPWRCSQRSAQDVRSSETLYAVVDHSLWVPGTETRLVLLTVSWDWCLDFAILKLMDKCQEERIMEKGLNSSSSVLFNREKSSQERKLRGSWHSGKWSNPRLLGWTVRGICTVHLLHLTSSLYSFFTFTPRGCAPCGSDIILVLCRCIIWLSVWLVATSELSDTLIRKSREQNSDIAF